MRVLVVTNMYPSPAAPQLGAFVRDQVEALRGMPQLDVELFAFPPGKRSLSKAVPRLRRTLRRTRFDVVHAHYGLTGWAASLAGASPLLVTFHGTDVRHPAVGRLSRRLARRIELAAPVSASLFKPAGGRPGLPRIPARHAVLPCGFDPGRFGPSSRTEARRRMGLDPEGRYLVFPADPARAPKRHDRALEVAGRCDAELLTAGDIPPERMPDLYNAGAAVLIPSDSEGFGLAAVEALACDVPVLSTPVGAARTILGGIDGCLVDPFDAGRWARLASAHLAEADPRVDGARRAGALSAERMARRVAVAYEELAGSSASTGHHSLNSSL